MQSMFRDLDGDLSYHYLNQLVPNVHQNDSFFFFFLSLIGLSYEHTDAQNPFDE